MEFAELIPTPKLDNVIVQNGISVPVSTTLCLTGHHLICASRQDEVQEELWLLHESIDVVERRPYLVNNTLEGGKLILRCKDLRVVTLKISAAQEYLNIAGSIEKLSNLSELNKLYPFFYRPMFNILENGWQMYQLEIEFSKLLATDEFRLSHVNKEFKVCATYPPTIIVPKIITDDQIIESAKFRDLNRFPMLSFRNKNGAILLRSAQPMNVSNGVKRCRADEAILNQVLGKSKKGFIVDTWGKNKSNTETDQHYSQWRKITRSIGNISSVSSILDSFTKMIEACNDVNSSTEKWLSRLENSGWLTLVLNSLNAACVIAQCLEQEGCPVLVHGGKGLDSSLIVCSLVQIILNPDCRTIRGFEALIEREWLQAGYPFSTRHKHSCYTPSNLRKKTSSSTFVLFLDCVYQLYSQFPCSFEFDSKLLIILFEHCHYSQYGTFLGDNPKERAELQLSTQTVSLWSYLNLPKVLNSLLNLMYEPNSGPIWPSIAPISLVLWSDLYLRYVVDQSNAKLRFETIQSLITQEKELRSKVLKLRRQLIDICKDLEMIPDELTD